jgi:hypothetical protein
MQPDPEALAQLARLLGLDSSGLANRDQVRVAVELGLERLTGGLLAEAAASDDVSNRDSALDFINRRLDYLGALLTDEQRSRLLQALRGKIEVW